MGVCSSQEGPVRNKDIEARERVIEAEPGMRAVIAQQAIMLGDAFHCVHLTGRQQV